jgi:hypothetical protein
VYTIANGVLDVQDQEAKDPPIPLSQRHGPKVPKKPQTRSPRHDEGVEGGQGGEEGYCVNWGIARAGESENGDGHVYGRLKNRTDDQVMQGLHPSRHWKWHHWAKSELKRRVLVCLLHELKRYVQQISGSHIQKRE